MDRKHMNGLRLSKETLKSLSGGDRYIKRSPGGDLVRRNEDAVNLRGSNGILCTASAGSCMC